MARRWENVCVFNLVLECKLYARYIPSPGGADQCPRRIVPYERSGQERNGLFLMRESMPLVLEMFRNIFTLKRIVAQSLG